jgi:hypothetical protein
MGDVVEQPVGNAKATFSSDAAKLGPADYSCNKKKRRKSR